MLCYVLTKEVIYSMHRIYNLLGFDVQYFLETFTAIYL